MPIELQTKLPETMYILNQVSYQFLINIFWIDPKFFIHKIKLAFGAIIFCTRLIAIQKSTIFFYSVLYIRYIYILYNVFPQRTMKIDDCHWLKLSLG